VCALCLCVCRFVYVCFLCVYLYMCAVGRTVRRLSWVSGTKVRSFCNKASCMRKKHNSTHPIRTQR
jgi:hypothetical protein